VKVLVNLELINNQILTAKRLPRIASHAPGHMGPP